MSAPFTDDQQARLDREVAELLTHYPADQKRAALMPILRLVQDRLGWLPLPALEVVADRLGLHPSQVLETASFYVMFHLSQPGKYVIDVCTNIACSLCGSDRLLEHLEKKLGCRAGQISADGRWMLRETECLASCGTGPCLQINEDHHENLSPARIDPILAALP